MQDPRFFPLALHRLPFVGAATYHKLIKIFGSAEQVFKQSSLQLQPHLKPETLLAIAEFQQNPEASLMTQKVLADLAWLESQPEVQLITYESASYPELLNQTPNFPPLLFVRGDIHSLSLPQIAIVGSRNSSAGGCQNAQRFAEFLAAHGFVITSGLALGIDAAAHQGALDAKGKTIAVMGTGIDLIYPAQHRKLAQQILASGGALVSELPLGSSSKAANFPQRNRIISGLSCGVLVVEAAVKSGSLITAKAALQQNREVFAIPGSIHNPLARGCHQLIRQGATLVETAQDIVDELAGALGFQRQTLLNLQQQAEAKAVVDEKNLAALSAIEQEMLQAMGYDPIHIDDLAERVDIAVGTLASALIGLELQGFVRQLGSGYQRV